MIKSIVIVRLSALGDVLMLVPLIRRLQEQLVDVKLTWIIARPAYDLVANLDGVEFIVIEKPKSLLDYWRFYRKMRMRSFDVLLAPQASLRANLLYPLIRAHRKIGYDNLRARDLHRFFVCEQISPGCDHTLEGFLKFATALGLKSSEVSWNIPIPAADSAYARDNLPAKGPVMIVNPASSKPERSWHSDGYVAVIKEVQARWGAQVILTGGPGAFDAQLATAIANEVEVISLVGKTKPNQLLALIKAADLVLCPDTGPSHMAAAVETPVVALHAITNPAVSGPYTYRELVVDCYQEALQRSDSRWGEKAHGLGMELITPAAVLEKIAMILG